MIHDVSTRRIYVRIVLTSDVPRYCITCTYSMYSMYLCSMLGNISVIQGMCLGCQVYTHIHYSLLHKLAKVALDISNAERCQAINPNHDRQLFKLLHCILEYVLLGYDDHMYARPDI